MMLLRLAAVILLAAGICGCSNNKSSSNAQASSAAATEAPQAAATTAGGHGASVYTTNCASCHGANGQGTPGVFPPLAANPVVSGDPKNLIHIVKYGLTTAITVGGKSYHGMMPAWSPQLPDADIAAVLTYVRSSFGNSGGPITTADVSAVSK